MENIKTIKRPNRQKKYRKTQSNNGLVRFELQISAKAKAHFDRLVEAVANEYAEPFDPRRRRPKRASKCLMKSPKVSAMSFLYSKIELPP